MITKLDSLNDIANEFGVPLSQAGNISYYYNNKNPYSTVQPVMAGGRITDWIWYDHNAVYIPPDPTPNDPNRNQPGFVKCWFEPLNPNTRTVLRFFFTTPNIPTLIHKVIYNNGTVEDTSLPNLMFVRQIRLYGPKNTTEYQQMLFTTPVIAKYNTDTEYMIKATGTEYVYHVDCKPINQGNFIAKDILDVDCTKVSVYFDGRCNSLYPDQINKIYMPQRIAHTLPHP